MNLPDFLVLGAMKSATTSLCELLDRHPDVFVCEPKEPEFFCRSAQYDRGIKHYAELFEGASSTQICGEGSTSYTKANTFPGVAARVASHLPDVQLIYLMRDPIRRIESHWMHTARTGHNPPDLNRLHETPTCNYIDTSLYWRQLSEYREHFDESRFLLLFYEDFVDRPNDVLRSCFEFLGISELRPDDSAREPRHVSLGSRIDRPILRSLYRNRAAKRMVQLLPRGMRDTLKRPFQKTLTQRPQWKREPLKETIKLICDDARQVLTHCGKPADYWPLQAEAYLK